MPNRSEVQAFLKSIGLEGWAESAEHVAGVEKVVEALCAVSKEMAEAGNTAASDAMDSDYDSRSETSYDYLRSDGPALIYKAMFSARFKGE